MKGTRNATTRVTLKGEEERKGVIGMVIIVVEEKEVEVV